MNDVLRTNAREKYTLFFYILLLIFALVLTDPYRQIPEIIRIGYLMLVLIPGLKDTSFFVFGIVTFLGISLLSFNPILPTTYSYYIAIVLFYTLLKFKSWQSIASYLPFFLYFFMSAMLHLDLHKGLSVLFIAILLSGYMESNKDLSLLLLAFLLISIFMSATYFINMEYFLVAYGTHTEELERSAWANPNEFGLLLGCGAVLAMAYLTNHLKLGRNKFTSIVSIVTLLLTTPALILNASRGAFLSFALVSLYFLFFSKTKKTYKLLFFLVVIGFVLLLYSQGTFDLLFARMGDDTITSGGGRTSIWQNKLNTFLLDSSFGEFLFGIGMTNCNLLVQRISTHNDIVTAFIAYGLIGLILFLLVMLYPCIKGYKKNGIFVTGITLYMLMEACVAEPFFRGHFVFVIFYFFMLRYSEIISKART